MMDKQQIDSKSSFFRGRLDSYSTVATSFASGIRVGSDIFQKPTMNEQKNMTLHQCVLQSISENSGESEKAYQQDSQQQQQILSKTSSQTSSSSSEQEEFIKSQSICSEPGRQETQVFLRGYFVIGIRDQEHLKKLACDHSTLLYALIRNFISAIYLSDIEINRMKNAVAIIPDYFSCHRFLTGISTASKSPLKVHQEILTFQTLIDSKPRYSILQEEEREEEQKYDEEPRRRYSKSKSLELKKEKSLDRKKNILLEMLNLETRLRTPSESSGETPMKENQLSVSTIQNSPGNNQQEPVIAKQCCKDNFSQCSHRSKISLIKEEYLLMSSFTSENRYYFCVLLCTYERIYTTHTNFFRQIMQFYYTKRSEEAICLKIIQYVLMWLEYRQEDLIDEQSKLFSIILFFIEIALLINFNKYKPLEFLLIELKHRCNDLKKIKQQKLSEYIYDQPLVKRRNRRLSVQQVKNNNNQFKMTSHKSHMKRSCIFIDPEDISNLENISFYKNIDWTMYIEPSIYTLQKQFWLIDVEYYKQIRTNDLLYFNPTSQPNSLKQISNHFDYLLYHMLFCIITCPSEFLQLLFTKLIKLSGLAIEAEHYQLAYLLYILFQHDITKSYLSADAHLSLPSQKLFRDLNKFGQNKTQYFQNICLDLTQDTGCIPCLSWVQLQLAKLNGLNEKWVNGMQFVNFTLLEQYAVLLFPLLNMLEKSHNLKVDKYLEQPYYDFFKSQCREQLRFHLRCEQKQYIEIELYKLRKLTRQQ